ncbi:MAG: glycosyltransferase family 39 protein [Acidobacteriota bacterium]|nr:glycosyltransferase family 39 protein [Acidobacteriota bacterium]
MKKRASALFFIALAALFLVLNRGAYQSYFQDDELDNLSWAPFVSAREWLVGLFTPQFLPYNFRPAGHFFFFAAQRLFGLNFPAYAAVIQAIHFLNTWLIWMLARTLGCSRFAAGASAVFFALNMAAFDAIWKPMYVFELLCATFCLLSILLWIHNRWLWSFAAFWLAYKSKELAVMLPFVIALYELWFNPVKRRWLQLAPFFLAAVSFGIQGLAANGARGPDYTFQATPASLWNTAVFYASRLFLIPYAAFALPLLALLVRDRRVWWSLAAMALFFVPLLLLPGRLYPAYCYLPLAALAITVGATAGHMRPFFVIALALLWFPWQIRQLRIDRRATLAIAEETKPYVRDVLAFAQTHPHPGAIIYDGLPLGYARWGVEGAFRIAFRDRTINPVYLSGPEPLKLAQSGPITLLLWDRPNRRARFLVHRPGDPDASFIHMDQAPFWQLDSGWLERGGASHATTHLLEPATAKEFAVTLDVSPRLAAKGPDFHAIVNGRLLGDTKLTRAGIQTLRWPVSGGADQSVRVAFDLSAGSVQILAFGFR